MKNTNQEQSKLKFLEINGTLQFKYSEPIDYTSDGMILNQYYTEGVVPPEIIAQGQTAVMAYVKQMIDAEIGKQKAKRKAWDTFMANPNIDISVRYDNKLLTGTIIRAEHSTLVIEMTAPYPGETRSVRFGWASAMSGRHLFKGYLQFSDVALASARQLLIEIYKREKHKEDYRDLINLAENLNEAAEG